MDSNHVNRRGLVRIGPEWSAREPHEFIAAYTAWFKRELAKGYPVAWIGFEVING